MSSQDARTKVPEVTIIFWIIKVAATTLGETAGDALSMSMNLGYLISTGIFAGLFLMMVGAQITAKSFHPYLYWATIIATTTLGTTMADFADRSLGRAQGAYGGCRRLRERAGKRPGHEFVRLAGDRERCRLACVADHSARLRGIGNQVLGRAARGTGSE